MNAVAILIQVAISLFVVALYHLWVSRKKQPAPAPSASVAPVVVALGAAPPKTSSGPAIEPVPPEIIAVVAAAIAVVINRPHRVLSVQRDFGHTPEVNVWALEGRVEQFMSHRVR